MYQILDLITARGYLRIRGANDIVTFLVWRLKPLIVAGRLKWGIYERKMINWFWTYRTWASRWKSCKAVRNSEPEFKRWVETSHIDLDIECDY